MRCLILGGNGFIGSHLRDLLLREGHAVRVFDHNRIQNDAGPAANVKLEYLEGDFINLHDIAEALAGCEVVYHLVSTTLPKSSNDNPAYDVQTNIVGTLNLLELAKKAGIRKIIFVSSGGTVYGVPQQIPISESHQTEPICSYGITKLTIEKYLSLYSLLYGLDYCVLRLANPYGERQRVTSAQGAISVFLHKAARNEMIEIWGDGSVVRDYIYIGDAVVALSLAKSYNGECRVFNIGAGCGQSLNDILTAIESLLGRSLKRHYLPGRLFDVPSNVLDISRAQKILGWSPRISLQEGLSRTWEWLLKNDKSTALPFKSI